VVGLGQRRVKTFELQVAPAFVRIGWLDAGLSHIVGRSARVKAKAGCSVLSRRSIGSLTAGSLPNRWLQDGSVARAV